MSNEAKPSPREVLLSIVGGIKAMQAEAHGNAMAVGRDYPARSEANGEGRAYRDAITLIRSMAGHLMEQTDGH
jgi:hypothetical protein